MNIQEPASKRKNTACKQIRSKAHEALKLPATNCAFHPFSGNYIPVPIPVIYKETALPDLSLKKELDSPPVQL
jgi:hypothetical protein